MALPGLLGIEHVGLTVPDLDEAVRFFVEVIGCTRVFDGAMGPDPEAMAGQLGVPPDATLRYAFLRCRSGPNLEVFEYHCAEQNPVPPRNSDIGGHHLCFYVTDIAAAVAHLRAEGVEVMGPVSVIEEGPAAGSHWVYVRAPWGLQLELVSFPDGKGAPGSPARRLWRPDGAPG